MHLIDYLVNDLVPDDESLCLIARINGFGGFDPHSPALVTRLNDFERGHRSKGITIGSGEYRFFGCCAEICKHRHGGWSHESAQSFIQYTSYLSAVEIMRDTYSKMRDIDPENLSFSERQIHLEDLADMEAVMVAVERARLRFDWEL